MTNRADSLPDLLGRLARLDDPIEASTLLLERVLRQTGQSRGLVALRMDDRFDVAGLGTSDEETAAFQAAATDPGSELGNCLAAAEAGPISGPEAGGSAYRVIPFGDGPPATGAVILPGPVEESVVAEVADFFDRWGNFLERTREFALLERRATRLERQRSLLSSIVNGLPDPVLLTDSSNNIIMANDRADQLFSTDPADSEGRRRAVQLNNLLFSSFLTRAVISTRQAKARELNLVDPSDGSDLLFEVLPVTVPESVADEGAILSILRNITDLKRAVTELEAQFQRSRIAEERVRDEWERLNATLENVGDPILVTDDHSNIILMNREAERLFEAEAGSAAAVRRAVRANDTKFTSLISDFLLQPEDRRVETLELVDTEDAVDFPVEVVSSKILNARGEPTAIVSVIHDLTQMVENERLARELQELNEELEDRIRKATLELEERARRLEWQSRELEKASRLKSEFLASMSHELRTPINAVLGYTSLMSEEIFGELTSKQSGALDKINSASQHLLDLINDILDLSKIEAGKMPVYLEEVELEHVVREISEAVDPLLREKDLTFDVQIADDVPTLNTDRTKLKQILLNLISNAIKFTSEGSVTVDARGQAGGKRVRITVTDTGIGIRDDDLEKIFDDFRQVDQSPTREYGGTGLGLSITRKLLSLLGGDIHVESEYGKGTRFAIEMPAQLTPGTRDDQIQRAMLDSGVRAEAVEGGRPDHENAADAPESPSEVTG